MKGFRGLALLAAGCAAFFLSGCYEKSIAGLISGLASGGEIQYNGEKGGVPVNMSKVVDFSFSYSTGTYYNSGYAYEAKLNDDGVEVLVRQDGVSMEDVPVITTDASFMEKIEEILKKYEVDKWNGFHLSAKDVLDGDGFSLSVGMDNKERISASGYEAWPENYGKVCAELDTLFIDLYESVYPNKEKALKEYGEIVALFDKDFLEKVEVAYPYTSDGPGLFRYGNAELPEECVVARRIDSFTGDDPYTNDPRDLLIARLRQVPDEGTDTLLTTLSFEIYTIDDDMSIMKTADETVDEYITWNDGIYGSLFTHVYDERSYIGYFAHYSEKASSDKDEYVIRLYEYQDGEMKKVADEAVTAPEDRELTMEDYPNFKELAEKYGFSNSLKHWKEKPFDPVIVNWDMNEVVKLFTRTNYDSKFNETLDNTPKGEKVGDYQVTGEITGGSWSY